MNRLPVVALSLFLCLASLDAEAQNARRDAKPTIAPQYYTQNGVLTFKSEGGQVVGTYPHENGKIIGKLKGNELKGTWTKATGAALS